MSTARQAARWAGARAWAAARAAVLAAVLAAAWLTPVDCAAASRSDPPSVVARAAPPSDRQGDAKTAVFRLFLDLEDPASRRAWTSYRAATMTGSIRLIVHPLPLARHSHARAAAHAALVARDYGKAVAFIDALVLRPTLLDADLRAAARRAQLPLAAFESQRRSPQIAARVEHERRAAIAFGVRATPSALLVGAGISGLPDSAALTAAVAAARQRWRSCQAQKLRDCEGKKVGVRGAANRAIFDTLRDAARPGANPAKVSAQTGAKASAKASAPGGGSLGQRWRVTLPRAPFSLPGSPDVIAVWFLDPGRADAVEHGRFLRAEAKAERLRLIVVPINTGRGALAPALAIHGLLNTDSAEQRAALLRRFLRTGGGDMASLAQTLGVTPAKLTRAARSTAATVRLDEALRLAQRVDAHHGSLFLNGRRWRGSLTDPGLKAAVTTARAEARAIGGLLARERYGQLIRSGRQRSAAEADLDAPAPFPGLGDFADLGPKDAAVHAWLLLDLRTISARAAFYALAFLRDHGHQTLQLHVAIVGPDKRNARSNAKATPAHMALLLAARHGKGLACVRRLLTLKKPADVRLLGRIFKRIGLNPRLLRRGNEATAARTTAARLARSLQRSRHLETPVLLLGRTNDGPVRRYIGPIDENRIAAAVQAVQAQAQAAQEQTPADAPRAPRTSAL